MKPLLDSGCKFQKWVENANQTQLKPIFWYTSWYFSRGGVKKFLGGVKKNLARFARKIKNIYPPLQNPFLRPCSYVFNIVNLLVYPFSSYLCLYMYYFLSQHLWSNVNIFLYELCREKDSQTAGDYIKETPQNFLNACNVRKIE